MNHSPEDTEPTIKGVHAADLIARGLESAKAATGNPQVWQPPTPEELAKLLPQYEIEALLGRGGMGAVYRGRQAALDRTVAIKLLPAELAADAEFMSRLQREARTLAKLQHPGIVAVHDFGQTSAGHLYFVMEFVNGTDLARLIHGPGVNPAQALEVITQICDALQYAHSQGVIHRDIKPANVLINTEGRAKLADFGLARPTSEETASLTRSNVVMGTPDYMAPEQMAGNADHRADLYALGVMLYEMLTGQTPRGAWAPPSQRVQVDVRLDQVVVRALQQDPAMRYQQASEIKTDVDVIRTTPLPKVGKAKAKSAPEAPGQRTTPLPKAKKPGNKVAWVAAIVSVLALAAAAWFFQQHQTKDSIVSATKDAPFVNSLGMKFVPVPGTDILMCIHETRRREYATYADAVPGVDATWKDPIVEGKPLVQDGEHPVVGVSWTDAAAYCAWLSKKEGRTYRLPTEREWNLAVAFNLTDPHSISDAGLKALMAFPKPQFPWGTTEEKDAYGNYVGNEDGYKDTAPVMNFRPNHLGIFDLGGNAWEWCSDRSGAKSSSQLLLGCGYMNFGGYRCSLTRAANAADYRLPVPPLNDYNRTWIPGFRCVVELPPSTHAARVDERKPAVAAPSEAVHKARNDGGKLMIWGKTRRGSASLGGAAAFDDFVQVAAEADGWAARRTSTEETWLAASAVNLSVKDAPFSVRGRSLSRTALTTVLDGKDGAYRDPIYFDGAVTEPKAITLLKTEVIALWLDAAGTILTSKTMGNVQATKPPDDFFTGASAFTASEEKFLTAREAGSVESWNSRTGQKHTFPLRSEEVLEMDAAADFVAILTKNGHVRLFSDDGRPLRSADSRLTKAPPNPGPFVAVRAGRGMVAAQKPDGSWLAWGESDVLTQKVTELGHVIDLDLDYDPKESDLLIWIEPAVGGAAATNRSGDSNVKEILDWVFKHGGEVTVVQPGNIVMTKDPKQIPVGKLDLIGITMRGDGVTDEEFARLGSVATLQHIELTGGSKITSLKPLTRLSQLRFLNLPENVGLVEEEVAHLSGLAELGNISLKLPDATGEAFRHLYGLKKLKLLWLYEGKLTEAGGKAIASLSSLTNLSLNHCIFRDNQKALAPIGQMLNLTNLGLVKNDITAEGFSSLAGLKKLESLSLSDSQIDNAGFVLLAGIHGTLKVLNADMHATVSDEGIRNIVATFPNLEGINLSMGSTCTAASIRELAKLPKLKKMACWVMKGLKPDDYRLFADLPAIERLSIENTSINDEALAAFAKCEHLMDLALMQNGLTDAGLKALINVRPLRKLNVKGTKITAAGLADFQKARPDVTVTHNLDAPPANSTNHVH